MEYLVASPGSRAGQRHWWKGEKTACHKLIKPLDSVWLEGSKALEVVDCRDCHRAIAKDIKSKQEVT